MIRQEQCNKVCRILDDVLANRPTERDSLILAVRKAFDALEKQRWIPCSERLPEDEYVLISKKPTKISGSKWSVAIAIRTADPRSRKIQWRDSGFGVIQDDKVLAWMPLPEPYQEGEQE
jgi:hypothetical protein